MDLNLCELRRAAKQYRGTCQRTSERLLALIELAKREESRGWIVALDYERVATEFGFADRSLYRWKKRYVENGVKGVVPKVSKGRRAKPITGYGAKKITQWREKYGWGAEVISAHLLHGEGIAIKQGRVQRFLKRKGLIKTKRKYRRKSKHVRVVKVADPGKHTQTDVKHLPWILANRRKTYVYNFVDHASKWEFKRAYDSYGPSETKDFMTSLLREIPFSIARLQSDNGIEYTFKYVSLIDEPRKHALDEFCESNGIRHVLIPPGEKELQGLVERSHRMDDEELYHRIRPRDLQHFNEILAQHSKWKNSTRRRKSIGWKTPLEWLAEYEAGKIKNQENQPHTEETYELIQQAA